MIVEFTIPGVPQQQGSKRYVGKGVSIEANKNLKPWREVALSRALDARKDHAADHAWSTPVFIHAVEVTAACYFPRPASHYGTGRNADKLKASAPGWVATAPDLDKLLRAIGDVLTQSQIVRDDRLIVAWQGSKRYGDPRVDVTVQPMDAGERFT